MKKFLIITLAAVFCLAFALPAMAKVTVGGMITMDAYYFDQDANRIGGNGLEQLAFNTPNALNRVIVKYANDDNTVRGYLQQRFGPGTASTIAYAYLDWQLTPTFYLRVGRQTQAFAIMAPNQMMAQNTGHIVGIGFGNVHGGSTRDGIRAYIKFSDTARMEIEILDPDNDSAEIIGTTTLFSTAAGGVKREENTFPRIDIALPLTFGNVVVEPSVTYLTQEYDEVGGAAQDDVDIWGIAVGVKAGFGTFSFSGEVTYGENLGVGNYVGGTNAVPSFFTNAAGNLEVEDAQILSWWVQVGIKLGPSTLRFIAGQNSVELDNDTASGVITEIDQAMYGITWPISVAKGLTIRPEIMFYDFDDSAIVAGTPTNRGEETLIGVQFMLVF